MKLVVVTPLEIVTSVDQVTYLRAEDLERQLRDQATPRLAGHRAVDLRGLVAGRPG